MKEIKLINSKKMALVDDEDFHRLRVYRWFLTGCGYVQCKISGESTQIHRMVLGQRDGFVIDHISGNKLDNQKCNLRHCNKLVNAWNSKSRVTSHTGVKGVGWHKYVKKFQARANHLGKMHHFGYFDSIEEARQVYNERITELRGEFTRLA